MRALIPLFLSLAVLHACGDGGTSDTGSGGTDADSDGYDASVDCDDSNAAVHPDAEETCNGIDDDCDGDVDVDASDALTWYTDGDGDGYGDPDAPVLACEMPSGAVADATDCNDVVAKANPGATEICDGARIDEDCDGLVNDDDDSMDPSTAMEWYPDADHDYYGDSSATVVVSCDQPSGTVGNSSDCDDSDPTINPIGTEVCDDADKDEDCNGEADDADAGVDTSTQTETWVDADGDGFGDEKAASVWYCDPPSGVVPDGTDCDDTDPTIYPGGPGGCGSARR